MVHALLNWLRASSDSLRTSLWLLPTVMFFAGALLAHLMLGFQHSPDRWFSVGNGEDARNLLSTLLGAVIGMASIVFSITVVSLSLAANAYGPRLIRTFRSSRSTQLVIGAFMMTIVYLLLVLRAVRGEASASEVPGPAVTAGTFLALVSVLALLAFIHGVATLMVADEVVRRVRSEFDSAIGKLSRPGQRAWSGTLPADFDANAAAIPLPSEGYVQSVDYGEIVKWAERHHAIVRLDFRPGDFVVEGDHKVFIYPAPDEADRARKEIGRFIVSGEQRTPTQDLEFATRHLVEMAVRALSPGINDPFTALAVIDRLRGGLARLCQYDLPTKGVADSRGELRLWREETSFHEAADAAFSQIRQAGATKPSVLVHMLKSIGALGEHTRTDEQRNALAHQAKLIQAAGARNVEDPADRKDVEREFERAMAGLCVERIRGAGSA